MKRRAWTVLAAAGAVLHPLISVAADRTPGAVFSAYETAVQAGDIGAIDGLIASDAARPPFYTCAPGLSDRACLIDYIANTVVNQHSRFRILGSVVSGDTVEARLEVRNDLTRRAGVERFKGTDRIEVKHGKIAGFAFLRDEKDPQTARFFAFMASQRRR